MLEFGANPEGFKLKRLRDILDEKVALLSQVTDPDTGESLQIDFDADDGPQIEIEQITADAEALDWEIFQVLYSQFDPGQAVDAALRGLVQLNGIRAKLGAPSRAPIHTFSTVPGTVIPAGFQVRDPDNPDVIFQTEGQIIADQGGVGLGSVVSTRNGLFPALTGTLTEIVDPNAVPNLSTISNTADATLGAEPESNTQLRERRDRSTEAPSIGPVEALYSNLRQIEGVTFVRVYVNNDLVTDSRGIPAKTLAPVVVGGDVDEIGRTIFTRSVGGSRYFGNTPFTLTDIQGEQHQVMFTRPEAVNIFINLEIQITNNNTFPEDGVTEIQNAIIAYAQTGRGGLDVTAQAFEAQGFVPGENIHISRLYTPINSIPGHRVTSLTIGTTALTLTPNDVEIAFNQIGSFASDNIIVTVS